MRAYGLCALWGSKRLWGAEVYGLLSVFGASPRFYSLMRGGLYNLADIRWLLADMVFRG